MLTICAEIGINHNGDMNLCHELIRQASINRANIVKFQLYEPTILFADEPHLIEEGNRCQFSYDEFVRVLEWCDEEQIEPMFSVFDESRLEWTEKHNINQYKLASRSLLKTPEFCQVVAKLNKTTYASTGMVEQNYAKNLFKDYQNVLLLYCVAKYPAEYIDYKLQPKKYNEFYGISDHTFGIENALLAIAYGARFVEKHFTLSKTQDGSDHKCSITPNELCDLAIYGQLINKVYEIND